MSEDILIEVSPGETRIAFVDDSDRLQELQIERVVDRPLIEGIYRGRVAKLARGIGGAFVDIGIGVDVFLNRAKGIHEGETLIVQVFREAAAGKVPAVRREISITGRYLIFRPNGSSLHWPRSLKFSRKRRELEAVFNGVDCSEEGWTVRSRAAHAPEHQILREIKELRRRWLDATTVEGVCLLPPPHLVERVLRDSASDDSMIMVDDRRLYFELSKSKKADWPDVVRNLLFYKGNDPIYEAYGLADEIASLMEREVALPDGGRITIDRTEAMTVIDVDMGSAGGTSPKADAVFSANLSAASEIARQIRLRNLAGLIVVDFINMRQLAHSRKVVDAMRRKLSEAVLPVDVLGMTSGGLVEITRRRDGPALSERLLASDLYDVRPSREYLACEALRSVLKTKGVGGFRLVVSEDLAALLRGEFAGAFEETRRRMGGALELVVSESDDLYRIETAPRTKI